MALPIGSLDHGIFDLHLGIDEKILRSVLVFIFLAVALRLGGKRELAQINVLDLAVLLLASNALQNALIGNDNSVTGGVIGATTLFVANYAFVRLTFRHARIRRILEGRPRVLLRNGELDRHAMDREAITQEELEDQLLDKGMTSFDSVGLIIIETNGKFVFLNREQAKRLRPELLAEA
ncbi:MAG: YetF domain-containing protein [Solirubrobacterales bacterium]|jgi:uncharacterized membrane protein YcaP (DUF421 family)